MNLALRVVSIEPPPPSAEAESPTQIYYTVTCGFDESNRTVVIEGLLQGEVLGLHQGSTLQLKTRG